DPLDIKLVMAIALRYFKYTHVFLGSENGQGLGRVAWCQQHFDKLTADRLSSGFVDRTIEGDDAAKGRSRVGLEGLLIGLQGAVAQCHAARVGVLHNDAGTALEAAYAFPGSV